MKLPIAIHHNGSIYSTAEVKEATAGDIAKVKKVGENGDIYSAFLTFACVTCQSVGDEDSPEEIKNILKFAPFETVYAIAVLGMAKTRGVNSIEGRYKCSCGNIVEHTGEFADMLFDLECETTEDEFVEITLPQSVEIKNAKTGDTIEKIETLCMKYAVVNDLIKAFRKYPDSESNMQFEVYKNSIVRVNGNEIDDTWRSSFGDMIFQKMSYNTINYISKELSKHSFGEVDCVCMKCKKRWKAKVDLTNFFDLEVE